MAQSKTKKGICVYFQQGKVLGDILLELSQRKDMNAKEKVYLALMIGSMMSKPNEEN